MSEPVFDDPGPVRWSPGRPPVWAGLLSLAFKHPGRWTRVKDYPVESRSVCYAKVSRLRRGHLSLPDGTDPGQWEFRAGHVKNSSSIAVYAKFLG